MTKEDLKDLNLLLRRATFISDSALSHAQKHDIVHFYYYQVELRGKTIRLNVAKQEWRKKNGRIKTDYVLYSINDIKKENTEGDS